MNPARFWGWISRSRRLMGRIQDLGGRGGRGIRLGRRSIKGGILRVRGNFLSFNSFLLRIIFWAFNINIFLATIRKVTILMTYIAFKWDLLIIELLNMRPLIHFELDGLGEAFSQIYLDIDPGAGLHVVLWLTVVDEFSDSVPYSTDRLIPPGVESEVRKRI